MRYTPTYFFFLWEGKMVAHNLATQKYYEVDEKTFDKLISLSGMGKNKLSETDLREFQELGFDETNLKVMWDGDTPSHIAHQASRIRSQNTPQLSDEEYVNLYTELSASISQIPKKDLITGEVVSLPEPSLDQLENVSLGHCFRQRKTSRDFISKPIKLDQISNILFSCFGPIHGDKTTQLSDLGIRDVIFRRSSPSATGLASCDAILWSNNIIGLENGLYSYDESNHTLIKHELTMTETECVYALFDQFWIQNLASGIFIVNDMRRTWIKDLKCRGYLSSHQECGHLSQNILLSATAFNLKTWISGAFRDDFLQQKLSLPDYRFVSLFIGIGHGTGHMLSERYRNLLEKKENALSVNG